MFAYKNNKRKYFLAFSTYVMVLGKENLWFFSYILFIETEIEDSLRKKTVEILQANIGLYCNQACNHCFVESSPKRKEMMLQQTAERCLLILQNSPSIHTLDLTGRAKAGTASHTNTVLHVVALTTLILKMYKTLTLIKCWQLDHEWNIWDKVVF